MADEPLPFKPEHGQEWVKGSGVHPEIVVRNVRSLDDPVEIDKALNRKQSKSKRWQHWQHGPGWLVAGIEPATGETTYLGCQFKPDTPVQKIEDGALKFKKDGSPDYQKYFNASSYESEPLFLEAPNLTWRQVIEEVSVPIVITEGAKKSGAGLSIDYAAISLSGVVGGQKKGQLKPRLAQFCRVGRTVLIAFDYDQLINPNVQRELDRLGKLIAAAGAIVRVVMFPEDAPKLDDYLVKYGAEKTRELIDTAIPFELWRSEFYQVQASRCAPKPKPEASSDDPDVEFLQQACKKLYLDLPWICFGGTLHKWTGSYYKETPDEVEYARVRKFCNTYEVIKESKYGTFLTYPAANPTYVKQVLEWQKMACTVTAEQVNPPGINCKNGVLELHWKGKTLLPKLIPHSPDKYYLSEPKVTYDPDADPSEYERLMQCLDLVSRKIWERTIAAALDLATVRKYKGRCVRALFLKGDGANGKDTLRGLVQELFGMGAIASCSVTDFSQYDSGTYFKVYPLRGKLINWPSENADAGRVDQLKGLRAAITGDPLTFEQKYKQGIQEPCKAVFLFNVNEAPTLVTTLKASESRWGIIPFNKTYSDNPAKGELQADPRFKEDPLFVQEKILPAFLNRLLEQLQSVVLEGIDYSPTQGLLEEIQRESSHLLQFAQDTGLRHDPDGSVEVNELWRRLKQWYIDAGTLIVETTVLKDGKTTREKYVWVDQVKRSDRNVKGVNQVIPRLLELFPKAKKYHNRTESKRETGIKGLAFSKAAEVVSPESGVSGVSDDRSSQNQGFQNNGRSKSGVSKSKSGVSRTGLDADASSGLDDATLTPAQIVEPSQNGHPAPNDASDASFETNNSAERDSGYLKPGDTVGKRSKRGWVGKVTTVNGDTAEVLWTGDGHLTRIPLSELRLVA